MRLIARVLAWLAVMVALSPRARAAIALPVVFHVVHEARGPVASDAFLAAALDAANAVFAPLDLRFFRAGVVALPAQHAQLGTRADRDALLRYVERGAIHCMVVGSLMDVDEPGRERRGVHWYARGTTRPHAVIVSARAEPRVLAHELGHYLGLPAHRQVAGNVMGYLWGPGLPTFDADQAARIARTVARMRARAELRD